MKRIPWLFGLGSSLVALSAILYFVHYLVFHDPHHIFIYLVGDIAFVPFEVLLVTLILHRLLEVREKRSRMEKLNMVIGAFFSEVGTDLLKYLSSLDPEGERISTDLREVKDWTEKRFQEVSGKLISLVPKVQCGKEEMDKLQKLLVTKRMFLIRLLENPNLLEHQTFTELLWAVFHLAEELNARQNIEDLQAEDIRHLIGDVNRVYGTLVREWVGYMNHLRRYYPFLFSFAVRTNPFDPAAVVEVG